MSHKSKALKREIAARSQQSQLPLRGRRESVSGSLPRGWNIWLVLGLIVLVTFAAFWPALHNQFVNWDDPRNFLENPHYRGLGWTHLRWMWTTHLGHYIPLTWMTLGLDYVLWGMNPLGYHLTNLLLHAANAVVFFFIVCRVLTRALPSPSERGHALTVSAGFAALVFALHPLRVESVAWVTERRDVLSGFFYLLTILVYLRACEGGARGRGWYWLSVAVFVCALLSKSMVVNLPLVLLIVDVYPLRRLGGSIDWWSVPARRVYVEKIPFVLLSATASAIAVMAQRAIHAASSLAQLGVLDRLAISAYGLSFYLWKMIVPVNLSPLYERGLVDPWATPFLLSYGVVVALTALAFALRRRIPGLATSWLAYVVILLPVLGVFQSGPQIAADRYTYLAGLGWAILAGAGMLFHWRRRPFLFTGFAACLLFGLGILTWSQVQVWHDSEKLWAHALAIDSNNSMAHFNFGNMVVQQGKSAEANEHYRQALQIKPDNADAHNNWGLALTNQGKLAEAGEHFRQALQIKPDHAQAHNNWGLALNDQGKLAEAIEHYRQALQINPDSAEAHNNWGLALANQGKLAEAGEHFRQALQIMPDSAEIHTNLGAVLGQQGKLAEAIVHYRQALQINPDFAQARSNLLNALPGVGMGKEEAAASRKGEKAK